jgi:NAD(P)H dehydrogenase (quinone)
MPKILVLFHSRTGNTAALADAIAQGAKSIRFAEVDVRRIEDLAPSSVIDADPEWKRSRDKLAASYRTLGDVNALVEYDALILGSPTRDGVMSAELKNVLDQTAPLRQRGALVNKLGSAFTTGSASLDGHETALWSIMTPMATLGLILVPPGYSDAVMFAGGDPHGATAAGAPGEADLAAARQQGRRVAEVTGWITHAKSHHH